MKSKPLVVLTVALATFLAPSARAGNKYKVLYNFYGNNGVGGPNGGPPIATPVLDAGGNLYGPAAGGIGNSSQCDGPCGVVYKMTRGADGEWSESVALNFSTYFNLGVPCSPLVFDHHGNLYGSITLAGEPSYNWAFQMMPGQGEWDFGLIYQGYGTDVGGVVLDGGGNLYGELGVASDYHTTVGELTPGSGGWAYLNLYTFCENGTRFDGAAPRAPFSWDSKGNLYGTTYWGGYEGYACSQYNGCGVAFQMTPNGDGTWAYNVMHRFRGPEATPDGQNPWGGLTMDGSGSAYGTTFYGGPHATGTVFKLTPTSEGGWRETLVYGFPNVKLGAYPWGNLVLDKSGNLYGVGNGGNVCGSYFCGEVFKLTLQKDGRWNYGVVHAFKGSDGAFPYGVVINDEGKLFGTASGGGTYGYGVVFEITP